MSRRRETTAGIATIAKNTEGLTREGGWDGAIRGLIFGLRRIADSRNQSSPFFVILAFLVVNSVPDGGAGCRRPLPWRRPGFAGSIERIRQVRFG